MKRSEAAELVMMLMGAFPAGKTNESTSRLYEEMLADLDVTRARRAVTKLIRTAKFLPTISEIREEAGSAPLVAPYHREWKPPRLAQQNNRAACKALVVPKGAAGAAVVPADPAQQKPAAPADHPVQQRPIVPMAKMPARPPMPSHRRWTAEELEAELAKTGREK